MIYLGETSAEIIHASGTELLAAGREHAFLAEAVCRSLPRISLKAVDIAGLPWTEIDTPHDLDRARRELWPLIADRLDTSVTTWRKRRRKNQLRGLAGLITALGIGCGATWFVTARQNPTWETLPVPGGREVSLVLDGVPQQWWRVEGEEVVETEITGPRAIRIDLRCVLPPHVVDSVPYVVEVRVDGKELNWHNFRARHDPRTDANGSDVGDRDRIELEVTAGTHRIGIRRVAGDPEALLVRYRVVGGPER
jgi:hypothetical protein